MEKNIAVIWGDCSSPEIVKQTLRVLDKVAEKYGHSFHYTDAAMGGEAIDKYGDPLPQHELDKCLAADSVLLGAVGGPKWEGLPGEQRPEKGLLRLRAGMGLYSNNRPARIWPQLAPASPLKPEIVAKGIDFIIVRELIGGVYFGKHETYTLENGEKQAVDSMPYAEHEIERIGRIGFETWIRPTCWIPAASGVRSCTACRLSTPRWSTARCSWTTAPCRSSRTPASSTSSSPRTCSATSSPTKLP